jgi:hypothetical protein
MLSLVAMALCATLNARVAPRPAAELVQAPDRHVRTSSKQVRALIAIGVDHSATFASLVTELSLSDVIVYVESSPDLPRSLCGRLFFMSAANSHRFLRIQVRLELLSPSDGVSLIAHELQHAVEVARAPEVRDAQAMARLYMRIGDRRLGIGWYDTLAAQETGRQVLFELKG